MRVCLSADRRCWLTVLDDARELQALLADVSTLAQRDLTLVWSQVADLDYRSTSAVLLDAVPEIATQYSTVSGVASAEFYDGQSPGSRFRAVPAAPPPVEQVQASTRWALGTLFSPTATTPLELLGGSLQRMVFNTSRQTIYENSREEPGATFARYASANACAFCRMLATRGAVYASEASAGSVGGRGKDRASNFDSTGKRKSGGQARGVKTRGSQGVGDKYHDHCHCTAVPVRPGATYEPPGYVQKWTDEYNAAVKAVPGKGEFGAVDVKAVLREMQSRT